VKGDQRISVLTNQTVYPIDAYRPAFYQPAVVESRLTGRAAMVAAGSASIQSAASFEPPVVVIRTPANSATVTTAQAELSVTVTDQKQKVKSIKVYLNGRLLGQDDMTSLSGSKGLTVVPNGLAPQGDDQRVEFRFPITLSAGANRVEVIAENGFSEGRDIVEVTYQPPTRQQSQEILPNLWILAIAVNRYDDSGIQNLNYCVADARAIIDAFKTQEGRRYRKVNSLLIADDAGVKPTAENIKDNLSYLGQAGQHDVVMLFISGHGANDSTGGFMFLPSDAAFQSDGSLRASRTISYREILSVLDVPGQKLVFIDSCHSEGVGGKKTRAVDNNSLARELMDESTVIFTSSRGSELSQEDPKLGHGLFTYAIIEGMKGAADLVKDGSISMKELDTYVSERVPVLSGGAQHPTTVTPDGYHNFTVADVK